MKSTKRLLSLLLCLMLLFTMAACGQKKDDKADDKPGVYKAGTYTAVKKGYGGDISVTIEVDKDKILSVAIKGDKETAGVGSNAVEKLPDAIKNANSAEVDGVSGATVSSDAILAAAKDCLAQAKGESAASGTAQKPAAISMKPGTYTSQSIGFGGKMTVEATLTDKEITKINVLDNKETAQIFESAYPLYPDRIIKAQSVSVDAICGATASSNAILTALKDCIKQAGGDPSAFEKEIPKSTAKETYDCDIVVVGAGGAGMTAAVAAAENGAKVIMVEKAAKVGGTASNTTGGMGINPKKLLDTGKSITEEEINTMFNQWMKESSYKANGVILRKFINESGKTLDWMEERGFDFLETNKFLTSPYLVNNNYVGPKFPNTLAMGYYDAFNDYFKSKGGTVMLETEGKELLMDKDGNAVGITAEKYDGTSITINAKKVILATGGYAGSAEMKKKYLGYDYKLYGMAQNKGTGINMGLSAGAALRYPNMVASHMVGPYTRLTNFDDFDNNIIFGMTNGSPGLLNVDMSGYRFQNEAAATEQWVEGDYYWVLATQSQVDTLAEKGIIGLGTDKPIMGLPFLGTMPAIDAPMKNIQKVLDYCMQIGSVVKADSIEALAKAAGMSPEILASNIKLYNQHCEAKKDETFGKDPKYLNAYKDGEKAYYALKAAPYIYTSIGGLNVDENMRVLREDNSLIKGLYATGVDSMGVLFGGNQYLSYGGPALGYAFTSGRIAGEHAASQLK